jgi:3-oxoisoapionate kinase
MMDTASLPQTLLDEAAAYLMEGYSVILYTALGPNDPAIAETRALLLALGMRETQSGELIGRQLGRWTRKMREMTSIRRMVIVGGDTSGFVTSEMDVLAMEMMLPISPGAPLCKVYSTDGGPSGFELALKGGQLGSPDYFMEVKKASTIGIREE